MPLYRRVARRGFSNYPFKIEYIPINVGRLEEAFENGDVVDLAALKEKRVVRKGVDLVKVLGNGEITKKLTIRGLKVSEGATKKIEKAGGTVELEETQG